MPSTIAAGIATIWRATAGTSEVRSHRELRERRRDSQPIPGNYIDGDNEAPLAKIPDITSTATTTEPTSMVRQLVG